MNLPPLNSVLLWRCSDGLLLRQPDSQSFEVLDGSKSCKSLKISQSGRYIAWCNDKLVSVYDVASGSTRLAISRPDTILIDISPKDSIILLWESCRPETETIDNMRLFYLADDAKCGDVAGTFMHKRISHWFLQWSSDEKVAVRMAANGEILFYENNDFSKAVRRLGELGKISDFSMGPGPLAPLGVFSAGKQAQPSVVRLFSYPHSLNASGARLSLFRCDSVNFHWNATGTCALLVVTSEQSDRSYYGDRTLYFAIAPSGNTPNKGDDSSNCCLVPLFGSSRSSKSGTGGGNESQQVHSCCWHPDAQIFCAVYGPFPSRTTLFRVLPQKPGADAMSCLQRIADLEPATRNWAHFSKPDGRFLATGGFGGLRGDLQLWSVADPTQPRLLFSKQIPDANIVEWSPDGQHMLVGTLSPRLRVNNLFAVAALVRASDSITAGISLRIAFEWLPSTPDGQLWEVSMIKSSRSPSRAPAVAATPVAAQQKQNPLIAALESPSGVCLNGSGRPLSTQKAPEVYVPPHLRNKGGAAGGNNNSNQERSKSPVSDAEALQKRIKGVRRKLDDIDKLKERMSGQQLELNQMKKIESEVALREELNQLLSLSN